MKKTERDVMVANDRLKFGDKVYVFSNTCLAHVFGDLVAKVQVFVEGENEEPPFPMEKSKGSSVELTWKDEKVKVEDAEEDTATIDNINIPIQNNKGKKIGYVKKVTFHDSKISNAKISVEAEWKKSAKNLGIVFSLHEASEVIDSTIVDKAGFVSFEVIDE